MDAVFKVLPHLNSSMIGSFSYRVPTSIIASADITYQTEKKMSRSDLIRTFCYFQDTQDFPILKVDDQPLTSLDYVAEPYSCILDLRWLNIVSNDLVKIVLWYDNEYGYSMNVVRQLLHIYNQNNKVSDP
jgi:glyceraldehyde 3-phosphate dehydrogenase